MKIIRLFDKCCFNWLNRIAVDPLFPPPAQLGSHKGFSIDGMLEMNKYELIFDEADES